MLGILCMKFYTNYNLKIKFIKKWEKNDINIYDNKNLNLD
jgi:hypothetical protein